MEVLQQTFSEQEHYEIFAQQIESILKHSLNKVHVKDVDHVLPIQMEERHMIHERFHDHIEEALDQLLQHHPEMAREFAQTMLKACEKVLNTPEHVVHHDDAKKLGSIVSEYHDKIDERFLHLKSMAEESNLNKEAMLPKKHQSERFIDQHIERLGASMQGSWEEENALNAANENRKDVDRKGVVYAQQKEGVVDQGVQAIERLSRLYTKGALAQSGAVQEAEGHLDAYCNTQQNSFSGKTARN